MTKDKEALREKLHGLAYSAGSYIDHDGDGWTP